MLISLDVQVKLVIFSFLAGVLTGILFDIYRVIRGFNNPNAIITAISDILFWILCGIIIFIFLFKTDYGYMGFYPLILVLFGLYLYYIIISKHFIRVIFKITAKTLTFIRIIFYNIIYPFQIINYKFKKNNKK